ncbi:MAG TPA: HAD-IIIA family hydrolase [Acidobacteriota bacterium]|nr:HAD-IIIA family hydrolase [Acidobacteriota bacterium]
MSELKPQAVFLGRDGVLIKDIGNIVESDRVTLLPSVGEVLHHLNNLDIPILMVFNEPLIGYGILAREKLMDITSHIQELLKPFKAEIDTVLWCPHKPQQSCFCRLPKPGLLYAAATKHWLDLRKCIYIGDTDQDVQAAKAVRMPYEKVKKGLADWKGWSLYE